MNKYFLTESWSGNLDPKTNTRYEYIDLLKGIGILLVVWGHTIFPRSFYLYSFHMPLFFFLSGILHRHKPGREFIIKKLNTLYLPYCCFTILSWIFYYLRHLSQGNLLLLNKHWAKLSSLVTGSAENGGNNPIWFLSCLFVISLAYWLITNFIKKASFIWLILISGSLVGYLLGQWHIDLPFYGDVALSGIVFYFLGHQLKEHNPLRLLDKATKPALLAILALAIALNFLSAQLNVRLSAISHVNMAANHLGNYLLFYLAACCGITALLILGYQLKSLPIFNFLGMNSLLILAAHKPLLRIFQDYAGSFAVGGSYWYGLLASIIVIAVLIPVIYLVNYNLPQLVGRKPIIQLPI